MIANATLNGLCSSPFYLSLLSTLRVDTSALPPPPPRHYPYRLFGTCAPALQVSGVAGQRVAGVQGVVAPSCSSVCVAAKPSLSIAVADTTTAPTSLISRRSWHSRGCRGALHALISSLHRSTVNTIRIELRALLLHHRANAGRRRVPSPSSIAA
ncbi:hypothetical protein SYNPS1DRAFT_30703 [Syncephalis pseudoplumigaleata]|uniref:Uncharacterized protein n=1 Tax=Syncephalis pseudoplumigaleata TaxID=1712513 RepID=A0A4P9YUM3_9FUNG|nr:hypothetical protein SYNPS1DRAFT_30703 [Syncephalis pseudoplumigaleata]|eukprot:RKP23544.1 hypothetical protein SYNPS1DRAFT_30703 [Syncephalis pseudoplumigaleata]